MYFRKHAAACLPFHRRLSSAHFVPVAEHAPGGSFAKSAARILPAYLLAVCTAPTIGSLPLSYTCTTRAVSSSSDQPSPRPVPCGLDSALSDRILSPPLCWPPEATGLAQSRRFRHSGSPSVGGSGTGYDELLRGANRLSIAAQTSTMLLSVRISEFIWRSKFPLAIRKSPLLRQNSAYSLWVGSTQTMGG
jgi:hypothetical protein